MQVVMGKAQLPHLESSKGIIHSQGLHALIEPARQNKPNKDIPPQTCGPKIFRRRMTEDYQACILCNVEARSTSIQVHNVTVRDQSISQRRMVGGETWEC